MAKSGKVVLVGAGPGDLDLLTLKGKEYLKQADCIVYDRLLNKRMLELAKSDCEKIFVGKANHHHTVPQDGINEILYQKALEKKLVVRLKGGDSYVFGRGGEEALYLKERDIAVEVVAGISSSIAALAAAGIPITHRGLAKGFQVITAHSKKDALADIDYSTLLDDSVTLVFLMGLSHVGEIARGLIEAGRDSETPAAVISNGTTVRQKKVVGNLSNIQTLVEEAKLESPAIIVVGKVVTLSDELAFFENRPLFGKKYFLPKILGFNYSLSRGVYEESLNDLELKLEEKGADVFAPATGKIVPSEIDLSFLEGTTKNDLLVFTSGNGVRSFFWNLYEGAGLDFRAIGNARFAVVGKKTAEVLKSFGVKADLVPDKQTGAALAQLINDNVQKDVNIYWLCGKEQAPDFQKNLSSEFKLEKIIAYENKPINLELTEEQKNWIAGCDGVILTSGSNADAVKNSIKVYPDKIFSIGPTCTGVINKAGVENVLEASKNSYEGLMELIIS